MTVRARTGLPRPRVPDASLQQFIDLVAQRLANLEAAVGSAPAAPAAVVGGTGGTNRPGPQGDPGIGFEYVYTRSRLPDLAPLAPSDLWGYRQPQDPWTSLPPSLSADMPVLWCSQRRIDGAPTQGDQITHGWSAPAIAGQFGVSGVGLEYIFARTAGPTPSFPSNAWGFDRPEDPWSDGAPTLTPELPVLWRADRQVSGTPAAGDTVLANWSDPVVVGRFGEDGRPGDHGLPGAAGAGFEYIFARTARSDMPLAPSDSWGFDQPGTLIPSVPDGIERMYSGTTSMQPPGLLFLFMAGLLTDRVYRWDGSAWDAGFALPAGESLPTGLAVDLNGDILLAGNTNDRVYRHDGTSWDAGFAFPADATLSTGLAVDLNGDILLVGRNSDRIFRWDGSAWDGGFAVPTGERNPRGLTVDPANGDILVLGQTTDLIYRWDGSAWDSGFAVPTGEGRPSGLAVDPTNGDILVVGTDTDRVYRHDGTSWDSGIVPPTNEAHPTGLAIGAATALPPNTRAYMGGAATITTFTGDSVVWYPSFADIPAGLPVIWVADRDVPDGVAVGDAVQDEWSDPVPLQTTTWTDDAPGLTPELPVLWQARRPITGVPAAGAAVAAEWSDPVRISRFGADGADAIGVEYIFARTEDETAPAAPSNAWGFGEPSGVWTASALSLTAQQRYLWRAERLTMGGPAIGDPVAADWSSPSLVGAFGQQGEPGPAGPTVGPLDTPPVPEGLRVRCGIGACGLSWADPFRQYSNHARTLVYRNTVNEFDTATLIGQASWLLFTDDSVQPDTDYWYWVRYESTGSILGQPPAGVMGRTHANPEAVYQDLLAELDAEPPPLASDYNPAQITEEIRRLAGQLAVLGANGRIPFGVTDGRVYLDSAAIRNASITSAAIEDAFLTNLTARHGTIEQARIQQGDIFDLSVGNRIRSSNFEAGEAGFEFNRDGSFELAGGTFRGDLQSDNFVPAASTISEPAGWRLSQDGSGELHGGILSDVLNWQIIYDGAEIRVTNTSPMIEDHEGNILQMFEMIAIIGCADLGRAGYRGWGLCAARSADLGNDRANFSSGSLMYWNSGLTPFSHEVGFAVSATPTQYTIRSPTSTQEGFIREIWGVNVPRSS